MAAARNACLIRIVSDAQTTAAINRFHEQVDAFTSTRQPPPLSLSSFVTLNLSLRLIDSVGTTRSRRKRSQTLSRFYFSRRLSFRRIFSPFVFDIRVF